MRMLRVIAIVLLLALTVSAQQASERIDRVFERFNLQSPGCGVGVVQNGKQIFAKGYGLADLEHNIPISPSSIFYMASVSKEFTAMSVLLLAGQKNIALTEPVRKFIPELPEYANSITLYHLLTHTSGVRDYLTLGSLAGRPAESVFTDHSALRLVARQKALNFEPGTEYLYSNSGYVLLSLFVKKVTGKNLDEFARENIFAPLEMKATRFQHDHSSLVPGKAFGYETRAGAWHTSNSMLDVVGDGGLYSSVDDMSQWAANFDETKVGALSLATMQTAATLKSGKPTNYGMGLVPGEWRGVKIVEHGGALGGYRTEFLRFPAQRLSVICLCNAGSANPGQMARQVAEIYIGAELKTPQAAPKRVAAVSLTPEEQMAKTGLYRNDERGYVEITERDGKLHANGPADLVPLDKTRFTTANAPDGSEIVFDSGTPAQRFEARSRDESPVSYERVTIVTLSESQLAEYAGEYDSRELEATYRILITPDGLSFEAGDQLARKLRNAGKDHMRSDTGGLEFVFARNTAGKVTGFHLNAGRVRGVQFSRQQ